MQAPAPRIWLIARPICAIALVLIALAFSTAARGRHVMNDFKPFYCSARALLAREDPYAAQPLMRCEANPAPAPLLVTKPPYVVPAPIPGYEIAAFIPLAVLPFPLASLLWLFISTATLIAAVALFSRLGVGDVWTITVALGISIAFYFPVGELLSIALFGIALAAWAGKHGNAPLLGVGIALTFCEPQVGLAVLLAAIALGLRCAVPAILAALTLAIVSVCAIGIKGNVEYFEVVLPAHLLSEIPAVMQFSLSSALYQLGVAAGPALLLGRLSWIVMLGVAFWFARMPFARKHPEAAFLAAPAFAVVGGPFLHLDHLALAIPAALWLAVQVPGTTWLQMAAVLTLSLPLFCILSIIGFLVLAPFFGIWLGTVYGRSLVTGLYAALATIVVVTLVAAASAFWGSGLTPIASPALSSTLAQGPWAQYIANHLVVTGWTTWLIKAPTWFGIIVTAAGAIAIARRSDAMRLRTT